MSIKAQAILAEIKSLPAPELQVVSLQIQQWMQTPRNSAVGEDSIHAARGLFATSHLN